MLTVLINPGMIFALDDFLLDRVFQPISDWAHDCTGIEPQAIANFFAAGFVFCDFVESFLRFRSDPTSFGLFTVGLAAIGTLLLATIIVAPAPGRYGRNPKRYLLFYLRFFEVGTLLINTFLLPLFMWSHGTVIAILHLLINLFYVIGLYFSAVDRPPPRRFVAPKGVEMAS